MNLWPFKRAERRATGDDPSWQAMLGSSLSASGQHVDAKTAEGISAVFGCVQSLSESTACLPLHVYERSDDGQRKRADDHPLARVLRAPNASQTGLAFRETMTAAVLLYGNAYAKIEWAGDGSVRSLTPIHSRNVTVLRLPSGRHVFDATDDDGKVERLLQEDVFHLRDRCEPGSIVGKSRIAIARDTLGLSLSLREHGAAVFKHGARPSGVLESERQIQEGQQQELRAVLNRFEGSYNAGRVMMLTDGLKFKPLSMNLEDAQWIAAQQFGVEEVCRIYRVPPTMVGDLRHGNYSNTVELGSQFVRYSLQRWLSMWEAEISRTLLGPIARRRYYAEHSAEGLLRGNPEARADFYQKAIAAGWMTVNEVRALENMPPRDEEQTSRAA